MTPVEMARLLAVVTAAYPTFEVDEIRHGVWMETLSDLDYQLASQALKRHVTLSKWPPSVAEIREHAAALSNPSRPTGSEAWGELMHAVRRYGLYAEAEGLASLSPEAGRVARQIGWREINMCETIEVLRGQFLRMYQQIDERTAREVGLPRELRNGARCTGDFERIGEGARQLQEVSGGD